MKSRMCDTTIHPKSNGAYTRVLDIGLKTGDLTAHWQIRLMLLGSPPDMVRGRQSRKTRFSTASEQRGCT